MKLNNEWRMRLVQILLGAAIVMALVVVRGIRAGDAPVHLTTDWSHRHLIFSAPHNLGQQVRLLSNPRYVQQSIRRNAEHKGGEDAWRWRRAPENPDLLQGDWSMDMGSSATVGAGNYAAKFSFNQAIAYCATPAPPVGQQPDFVVYNTSLPGSSSQASIVAFDNLYVNAAGTGLCTGTVPSVYWAYNTGTTGAVLTSPVLSFNGTQVAFVQNAGSASTLVLLKWAAGTGSLSIPVNLTGANNVSTTNYRGCTAPCMTTIAFSTANDGASATDTNSSPFYDYVNDAIYVGESNGYLHKFTGVFNGTPSEVVLTSATVPTTADRWPAAVSSGNVLTSPVFDEQIGKIFVGSSNSTLYNVDATLGSGPGGITNSGSLGTGGIDDSPVMDVTLGNVYVFERQDHNGAIGRAGVYQCTTALACTEVHVSSSDKVPPVFYAGDFDNTYYTSSNGTGNMYVCSTNGGLTALWKITVTAGALSAPTAGPTISTANIPCSPVTEIFNPNITSGADPNGTDSIYLSVSSSSVTGDSTTGNPVNCPTTTGCLMSYDITSATGWNTTTKATSATALATGGASAIIVDNSVPSAATGASQVYFTPLADQPCTTSENIGGCAIQALQSGLN